MSILYDSWDDPQGAVPCARRGCPVPAHLESEWCEECRDAEIRECLRGAALVLLGLAALLLFPW